MPVLTNAFTPPFTSPPATAADMRQVLSELQQLKAMVQKLTDALVHQQQTAQVEQVRQKAAMSKMMSDAAAAGAAKAATQQKGLGPEAMFQKAGQKARGM